MSKRARNIIVVDLDDSLHEYSHTVAIVALNEFGIRVDTEPEEWRLGMSPVTDRAKAVEIYKRCHSREYIFMTKAYPGAAKALQTLHSRGFEIHYYTDRTSTAHDDTLEWLEAQGLPTPENLHCCADKRKELLKLKGRVVTVVDDRPRTMFFALNDLGCKHIFSMSHSHNRGLSDIEEITMMGSWDEFIPAFDKEILVYPALSPYLVYLKSRPTYRELQAWLTFLISFLNRKSKTL